MRPKIKVGLLLDGHALPAWAARLVELLGESRGAELVAIAAGGRADDAVPRDGLWSNTPAEPLFDWLARIYRRLIDRNPSHQDPWALVDNTAWPDHVTMIDLGKHEAANDDAPATAGVDVWIHCGLAAVPTRLAALATHGVWSIAGVPAGRRAKFPAGFIDAMRGDDVTRSTLAQTDASEHCTILYESFSSTLKLSASANSARYYWKALHFFPRMLDALHDAGADAFYSARASAVPDQQLGAKRAPGGLGYLVLVVRSLLRKIRQLIDNLLFDSRWALQRSTPFDDAAPLQLEALFADPRDAFLADPHLVPSEDGSHLFYEEYDYASQRGHISVQRFDKAGREKGAPEIALQRPYHLSYPFVFSAHGKQYMIPETSGNGTIEVYEAQDYPHDWQHVADLFEDIDAADTTLLFHNDKWWLFTSIKVHPGTSSWDELFLFHADDCLSRDWTPHPQNPIVSDCRAARPAGAVFRRGERLIRPSQESSRIYGSGLNFFEITELSETRYSERLIRREQARAAHHAVGIHSYAECGELAFVDQYVRRLRILNRYRT